ncbi:MAG: ATP-binding protein [Nitriliruptorales bacterium]
MTRARPPETVSELRALDLVPEGVVLLDGTGTVRHVNARARSLLGIGDAAFGRALPDVLVLVDTSGGDVAISLLADQPEGPVRGIAERIPERIVRVVGAHGERTLSVAGQLLEDGWIALTFRHAGRRERVDAARSDLVATVSHEIRSPLTSVKGFTRTLLQKWERFSDEQKRQMLETVNADADRVTRLLNELLDVSRIDAGRVELHRQLVDVEGLLDRVVERAQHLDEGRTVKLEVEQGMPRLLLDPDKMDRVVTNLVDNALRYSTEGPVTVSTRVRDSRLEISVSDHGVGIAADQLAHIFGKFSRGRDTRRSGTGLGLYITRGLVLAHRGEVEVESTPGEGSTFRVLLPLPE